MSVDKSKSLIMAKRLRELRTEKGLSIEALKTAIMDKYEIEISIDSLKNYEVSTLPHAKVYKNEGMCVKYLRCLADFYGVSADYLLGLDVPKSLDISVREIMDYTGLSEENVLTLHAWYNIAELMYQETTSNLPETVMHIKKEASQKSNPGRLGDQVINIICRLIDVISRHPRGLCSHFESFVDASYKWDEFQKTNPGLDSLYIDPAIETGLMQQGFSIVGFPVAAKWHISQFCDTISRYLLKSIQEEIETTTQ